MNIPFHSIYIWETHPIRSEQEKTPQYGEQAQNVLLVLRYGLLFFLIILLVANIVSCKCPFPWSTEMRSKSILSKSKKTKNPNNSYYIWMMLFFLSSICMYRQHFRMHVFWFFNFPSFPLGKQYNCMGLSALIGLEAILPIFLPDRNTEGKTSKYSSVLQVETIPWLSLKYICRFCTGSALRMSC